MAILQSHVSTTLLQVVLITIACFLLYQCIVQLLSRNDSSPSRHIGSRLQRRSACEMAGSDLDRQIEQLRRCEYIKESEVKTLCNKVCWAVNME